METRNQQGFALLEVLIAGVIGIIVAFAVARAAVSATQSARSSELDVASAAMMSRIENAIDDPMICPTLWNTWNLDGPPTFAAAKFDQTSGPPPSVTVDRLSDGGSTDVARTVVSGGQSAGLTIDSMTFTEPVLISDNTYDWTFTIQSTKVAAGGGSFVGNPTTRRKIRIAVTTTGAPAYTATQCGPVASPEANQQVPMLRFTRGDMACTDTSDANKDALCSGEFSTLYVAASLQDLVPYRMFFFYNPLGNAGFLGQFNFTVADIQDPHTYSNSLDPAAVPARPAGTVFDVGTPGVGDLCHVACIRNTAPLRFVRGFWPAATANKTSVCQTNVGFAYVAASPNDLIRYGFRVANGESGTAAMQGSSPGAVFEGGWACRMGWTSNPPMGPGLDCTAPNPNGFPLACVLR